MARPTPQSRYSDLGAGLPWSSRIGVAITYLVLWQLLVLWLAMFLGSPGRTELWDSPVIAGISMRGFFHLTNVVMFTYVAVDFWGFAIFSLGRGRSRARMTGYLVVLAALVGTQWYLWPTV